MPNARLVDIAEAVRSELAGAPGGTFTQAFAPVRTWRPAETLADLKDLAVTVVPRGIEMASGSRSTGLDEYSVDVAVRKRVRAGSEGDADCDALALLVEQICDFFARRRLATYTKGVWVRSENVPVFSPAHLEDMSVFTSVVTVTYRVME